MSDDYSAVKKFWTDFTRGFNKWFEQWLTKTVEPNQWNQTVLLSETKPINEPNHAMVVAYYCLMEFHDRNCTQCEDLCEIHNMLPELTMDLSKECCRSCDSFMDNNETDCVFETTTSTYTSTTSTVSTYTSTISTNLYNESNSMRIDPFSATLTPINKNENPKNSNLLAILLLISCFVGKGQK